MQQFLSLHEAFLFSWVILPVLIFIARVIDVSIGTFRLIMVSRGLRSKAALLGFFELLIWIVAIGQIIHNLDNFMMYIAYAGGFATGTWVGMKIEESVSLGVVLVRIITRQDARELIDYLRSRKIGITTVDAQGREGAVIIIFSIVKRQQLPNVINIINHYNPRAFYSIEDVRFVKEGYTGTGIIPFSNVLARWGGLFRKGK